MTCVGIVHDRPVVVVANDATVKAGSWWPETIKKILRAQEVAMRQRIPIIYLVYSAGVNLPYQGGVFPGQYGAARIFYYNSIMRRYLHVPQISAVMGPCIAGGAYLPALSNVIFMVEGTSFMGLGGPNLVKGATGQEVDAEALGGARTHTTKSGVARYRAKSDEDCIERIRDYVARLPPGGTGDATRPRHSMSGRPASDLYDILPSDHRMAYDMRAVLACLLDDGVIDAQSGGVDLYARIEGNDADGVLRPGAFVEVSIDDRLYRDVISLPESALHDDGGGGDRVYVVVDNRLEARPVEVLLRDGNDVLLRGPLVDNELVVITRLPEIGPGLLVAVP